VKMQDARPHTFVFADMVGFTAFTAEHGDEAAADLAIAFCHEVSRLAAEHGAETVKAIGDAVMVRAADAHDAVKFAAAVLDHLSGHRGFPPIRIGMHTGPAVERAGDWFGATVNLAARVAGAAAGGEALVTREVRVAACAVTHVELRDRGRVALKHVPGEPLVYSVKPYRARPRCVHPPRRRHRRFAPPIRVPALTPAAGL
jgi:adenylate cyclase